MARHPGLLVASFTLIAIPSRMLPADDAPVFERDIRPILRAHCFDCHGARDEKKASLDLRLVRFQKRGGESGPAIVPGRAEESLLVRRIRAGEMPPGEARVGAEDIERIERWIAAGATTARAEPESLGPGLRVLPEDRTFWSFRPIERPAVPSLDAAERVRTPVDAFILAKLRAAGSRLSPDAGRRTAIQRLHLDLLGVPPTPAEIAAFERDPSPRAYEDLVDRLLASPRFGERWARHWLDIAGYADSEGATNSDALRSWAYKYRDYVIDSFNADKPLDRFLVEQLAGDELAGAREGDWTEGQIELLTATGFLRMAADGTGSGANTPEGRNRVVSDTLEILGSSLLALSVGCAECHDHRYDPISQRDYYALRAIIEPALDWQSWQAPQGRRVSLSTQAERERSAEIETAAQAIAKERAAKQAKYMKDALEKELTRYEEPLRGQLRTAYETAGDRRTEEQKALLKKHPSVNISPGVLYQYDQKAADDLKNYDKRIAELRATKPAEEFVRALVEPGSHRPETRLFHRGDHRQPRDAVKPGLPAVLGSSSPASLPEDDPGLATTGRRLAFARWLGGDDNPLTARVIANRVWLHLFGRGLVETPADFGKLGMPPTHPELLDWLASTLRADGWSVKRLIRRIVLSTTYRQSSLQRGTEAGVDPENRFYSRRPVRRLDAEIVRDRILAVSGRLDAIRHGPAVAVSEDDSGQVVVSGDSRRRSIYVQARRSKPVALLESFDAPAMETNCGRRSASTVATQSLILLNGSFILKHAAHFAARVERECEDWVEPSELAGVEFELSEDEARGSLPAQVICAWKLAYGRSPEPVELESALRFIREQVQTLNEERPSLPGERSPSRQAMTNLCHMLLISSEFLYVD